MQVRTIVSSPIFEQRYDWHAIGRPCTGLVEEKAQAQRALSPGSIWLWQQPLPLVLDVLRALGLI